jgi:hypothetical protein
MLLTRWVTNIHHLLWRCDVRTISWYSCEYFYRCQLYHGYLQTKDKLNLKWECLINQETTEFAHKFRYLFLRCASNECSRSRVQQIHSILWFALSLMCVQWCDSSGHRKIKRPVLYAMVFRMDVAQNRSQITFTVSMEWIFPSKPTEKFLRNPFQKGCNELCKMSLLGVWEKFDKRVESTSWCSE